LKNLILRSLALLFSLVILNTFAHAQSVGVSCFACSALTGKQCDNLLPIFDGLKTPRLIILWRTFANPNSDICVRRFLKRYERRAHTLSIHFQNGPGLRNRRLAPYELFAGESPASLNLKLEKRKPLVLRTIQREAEKIVDWTSARANSFTTVELSTGLEDNYSNQAFRIMLRALKKTVPENWILYRNPVGENENGRTFSGASFIELHGYFPNYSASTTIRGRCSYSNDGIDIFLPNERPIEPNVSLSEMRTQLSRARGINCKANVWWGDIQGLRRGQGFIFPRSRSFGVLPQDINQLNKLLRSLEK